MKLRLALSLSLVLHFVFVTWYFHNVTAPSILPTQPSLDALTVGLGMAAALQEAAELKQTNSEQQNASQAQVVAPSAMKALVQTQAEPSTAAIEAPIAELSPKLLEPEKPTQIPSPIKKPSPEASKKAPSAQTPKADLRAEAAQKYALEEEAKVELSHEKPLPLENHDAVNAKASEKLQAEIEQHASTGGKAAQSESSNAQSASYLAGLQRKIARSAQRLYPKRAKRQQQEGVVMVGFRLLADGQIENVNIVQASEFDALNVAAVKSVQRIKRYKARPEGVSDYFVVPISFKLR